MGNGYFRTSQTRKDKRRTKELTYNYVDRVRLAEHSLQQDYKCPTRGSGWRHNNKSISHLDLATSCHSTAFGPSHWSHNRQLRHSRSLDYAHLTERCKDPLDIAEFYWRLDPEADALYEDEYEDELPDEDEAIAITRYNGEQRQEPAYRDYNYANNSQQQQHTQHLHHNTSSKGSSGGKTTTSTAGSLNQQVFDFGNESCSLRRSRSLAVIREETFSDLQITATNNSRRSQLIPRARIVNRGFVRERDRLICSGAGGGGSNNKHQHHHHHHHNYNNNNTNNCGSCSGSGSGSCNNNNLNTNEELDYEGVELSLQQQHSDLRYNQLAQRHHHHHHHHITNDNGNHDNLQIQIQQKHTQSTPTALVTQPHFQRNQTQSIQSIPTQQQQQSQSQQQPQQSREADDYYDNLKRLDALTLGLVEQLHPWHSEKSDLESLNSDYFKNSLHQNHELQQQLDFEALEEAVSFLANEKPRIYQTRRQQRGLLNNSLQKLQNASDSYQENSQSSAFPETTTSNSDDQTDSASLSEQEYDLKKIEKIYKQSADFEGDEEGYELISLTTTTRTRFETTEDEDEEEEEEENEQVVQADGTEGNLKRTHAHSGKFDKLIAYDSVYLSSEESSEGTLHADDSNCETYERTTHLTAKLEAEDADETSTLLHFSIEDIIYEPQHSAKLEQSNDAGTKGSNQAFDNEIANKRDETEVVAEIEKRATIKEKQLISLVETVNTKIENVAEETTATVEQQAGGKEQVEEEEELLDKDNSNKKLETTTLYTQILKVGHTGTLPISTSTSTDAATEHKGRAQNSLTSITKFEGSYTLADTCGTTTTASTSTTKSTCTPETTTTSKSTTTSTTTSTSKAIFIAKAPSSANSTAATTHTSNATTTTTTSSTTSIKCLTPAITLTPVNVKPTAASASLSAQPTVGITSSAASKPKILSVVEKRKWKRHSDNQVTQPIHTSGHNDSTQLRTNYLDPLGNTPTPTTPLDYPLRAPTLKRQVTADSLTYLSYPQTNLSDNQYHSLPDVNIGQSLKVSECIDAKLRSSYNVNYTKLKEECCAGREGVKDKVKALLNDNATTKSALLQQRAEEIVTSEEIYDSIKRFGRAHQKARQKEYQELHEVLHVVKEKKSEAKEKKSVRIRESERQVKEVAELKEERDKKEVKDDERHVGIKTELKAEQETRAHEQVEDVKEQLTNYPDSLVDESAEKAEVEDDEDEELQVTEKKLKVEQAEVLFEKESTHTYPSDELTTANNSLEYLEQPKDAPDVEVEDFSKLIERRAKEIKEQADRRAQHSASPNTITELTGCARIRQLDVNTQPVTDFRISACVSQFRIIVTDAQNNIIEEDSIESKDASLNSNRGKLEDEDEEVAAAEHKPHVTHKLQKFNVFADVTISRQEKTERREKKERAGRDTKSTIVSTHTHRVASLKRVPSKPKRQQQLQQQQQQQLQQQHQNSNTFQQQQLHCYQQQHGDTTNKINNKCVKNIASQHEVAQNKPKLKLDDTGDNQTNYCNLTLKSKERRVLSTQIYKARPIKVLTANDSFRRRSRDGAVTAAGSKMSRPQILHVVDNSKRRANIFGGSNNANNGLKTKRSGAAQDDGRQTECEYLKKVDAVRNYWSKLAQNEENEQRQAASDKRDERDENDGGRSVQCQAVYRDRLGIGDELTKAVTSDRNADEGEERKVGCQTKQRTQAEQQRHYPEARHFILGAPALTQEQPGQRGGAVNQVSKPPRLGTPNSTQPDDYASFMPSIEIVELDGDKKATIVSAMPPDSADAAALANDANGVPQFDHIRYKVLKSEKLLRSNMMPRSKKEAQFDGLIQYLQEYSFQELLANNNVVIVEPVRTKIERPLTMAAGAATGMTVAMKQPTTWKGEACQKETDARKLQQQVRAPATTKDDVRKQKLFGGFGIPNTIDDFEGAGSAGAGSSGSGGGIKRHFFYQPVRVNRELYEEELPNPDIVRSVRKFFEENVLPTTRGGMQLRAKTPTDDSSFVERSAATQLPSPRARRARKYRYLTIDTSYGHMPQQQRNQETLPKQQQQLPAAQQQQINTKINGSNSATTRKWDTASLSSGISSGDLSSPCECTDNDANTKHATSVEHKSLKGVHVQEVIQRHNNRNMQTNMACEGHGIETNACRMADEQQAQAQAQTRPRPRPRSSSGSSSRVMRGVGGGGDDPTYRVTDIYEQHASQQQQRNFVSEGRNNRFGGGAELAETDDDEYAADEDLDDEVGESHYVSKDVLEKIRECGSTVTYYGGRVLQSNSPDPLHCGGVHNGANTNNNNNSSSNGHANSGNTNTMTLTRRRVRQIESSNACEPPKDCTNQQLLQSQSQPQLESTKQNFTKQQNDGQDKNKNKSNTTMQEYAHGDNRESSLSHFGIKFKLVKSNSCSSRLELAGTGAEIIETGADDTEVVKKMVHHFECTQQRTTKGTDNEEPLTINNQTPARKLADEKALTTVGVGDAAIKQVTVNNHINVPMTTYALDDDTAKAREALNNKHKHEEAAKTEIEERTNEKTYKSSAMDIRLSNADQRKYQNGCDEGIGAARVEDGSADGGGTLKVWRNKNVDLAYAMVKKQQQQQQQQQVKGVLADSQKSSKICKQKGNECETKQTTTQSLATTTTTTTTKSVVSHMKKVLESNKPLPKMRKDNQLVSAKPIDDDLNETNVAPEKMNARNVEAHHEHPCNGNEVKSDVTDIFVQANKATSSAITPILAPRSTQLPAQIVVPVEIHRTEQEQETPEPQARSISVASSRGSSVTTVITTTNSSMMLDKNVVRQYVANDKSLFERRKYDDIEFEEFEVYDPTKDYEKLVENEKRREEAKREGREYKQQQQQQQQQTETKLQHSTHATTTMHAASEDDENEEELKSDSYDYDSLEDKL